MCSSTGGGATEGGNATGRMSTGGSGEELTTKAYPCTTRRRFRSSSYPNLDDTSMIQCMRRNSPQISWVLGYEIYEGTEDTISGLILNAFRSMSEWSKTSDAGRNIAGTFVQDAGCIPNHALMEMTQDSQGVRGATQLTWDS